MFKTKNYIIRFKRETAHLTLYFPSFHIVERDGTWCFITRKINNSGRADCAYLHPIDRYDKVIGKKIALMLNKLRHTKA